MALLTIAKRKEYFKYLGLGDYNKDNILKFQKKYFTRAKDLDGIYGNDTDNLLRHCCNVKKYAGKNFKPEEFKCGCGRKYCTGYPSYMKSTTLANLQTIRTHYGKSMTITSGLRCKGFNNSLKGSSKTSKHLSGYAADFYMAGVTDTLARRKSLIAYIKKLPNHNYSYGNGWSSTGVKISAPNMGNAVHTDATSGTAIAVTASAAATVKTTTATKTETAKNIGKKVITFAASQKGKYKTRTNGGKDKKKYSNKFTKYFAGRGGIDSKGQMPAVYGYIPGYCTLFACYCLEKAGYKSAVPFSTLTSKKNGGYWWHAPSLMKYYKKKGLLKKDFTKALPGAIVFKGSSSPTHTCLFLTRSGSYIYTWDGNVGGGVTKNKRKKSVFIGYVNPPYK